MSSLSQIVRNFDGAREFVPSAEWLQGRTLYGGLSAALALQTVLQRSAAALPPLKSALISFIAPAAGPLRFESRILREGKSATFISADCLVESNICLRAEFLFATPRTSGIQHDFHTRPHVEPPESCEPMKPAENAPAFLCNFDLRPAANTVPLAGSSYPELVAWVRHEDAADVDPAVALMAFADAMPPATFATLTDLIPISSMTWTVDLPRPARPGAWHLMRSTSRHARDGYSFQTMEIWDPAGELVLAGSQTVALFEPRPRPSQ